MQQSNSISLKRLLIISFLTVLAVVSLLLIASMLYVGNSLSSLCGKESNAYAEASEKSKIFDSIRILTSQPNKDAAILDNGSCNIDVPQSYAVLKYFEVDMSGKEALSEIAASLQSQGFEIREKESQYSLDECGTVSGKVFYTNNIDTGFSVKLYETNDVCDKPGIKTNQKRQFLKSNIHFVEAGFSVR